MSFNKFVIIDFPGSFPGIQLLGGFSHGIWKNLGRNVFLIMVLAVALSCLGFLACGGNGESDPKSKSLSEPVTPSSQETDLQSSKQETLATSQISAIPKDWKTFQFEGWSTSFPDNWNGDVDAGVWWPGEGNLNMGRPGPQCSLWRYSVNAQ